MPPSEQIRALRQSTAGCRVLAYVDLSARLVLCADAETDLPQEALDALCLRGARLLGGPVARAAETVLDDGSLGEAILVRDDRVELHVRAAAAEEALCAILAPATDPAPVLAALRRLIDSLAPGAETDVPSVSEGGV